MKRIIGIILVISWAFVACEPDKQASQSQQTVKLADSTASPGIDGRLGSLTRELQRSPDNWALLKDRSLLYFQKGELDSAVVDVRTALDIYEDSPELHYLRGYYGLTQGDTSLAAYQFELAANYGSGNPDTYYQMGQIAFFQRNIPLAKGYYQKAASMDTLDPIYPLALGVLEESQQDYRQAHSWYQKALKIDNDNEKALLKLHDLWMGHLGNEDKALAYNRQVLDQNPTHPLGNYNKGAYYYRRAITMGPSKPTFKDEVNKAVEAFYIAINKGEYTSFAEPYFYRGHCYFMAERLDLALADFQKAIEIDSTHAQAYFYLGSINEYYQDLQSALENYKKALASDPDFPEAKVAVQELSNELK